MVSGPPVRGSMWLKRGCARVATEQSRPGRLVLVDDEPVILELLATVFEDEPYEVVACPDGTTALAAMQQGVDVLLTDKNLPDIGGLDLVQHARRLQPDSECIIITGYASLDTALEAMALDVFDYIVKPPKDIYEVRRKVRLAFDRQRMRRENERLMGELQQKNAELEAALTELHDVQAELIQSEKLAGIGTLAAGIAHEISSPLFGIMGLGEAITDETDIAAAQRYASEIVEYSRTIRDIIGELSGYSRTADTEYLTTVELRAVVDDASRLVTRSMGVSADAVVCELEPGLLVNARTSELQQVFVNLFKNAIQAVTEGGGAVTDGCVRVSGGRAPQHVWVAVADQGPGIADEKKSVIFDPFFTTKPPGQGTGLGLNIVYRIVTKYRGTVNVDSQPGEGAEFRLRFPVEG